MSVAHSVNRQGLVAIYKSAQSAEKCTNDKLRLGTNAADCNLRLVAMYYRRYPYGLKLTETRLAANRIFEALYFLYLWLF